jgi:hypothetical protein
MKARELRKVRRRCEADDGAGLVDPFGECVAEARELAQALSLSGGGPANRGPTRIGAIPSCDHAGIVDGGSVTVDGVRRNAESVNCISCGCSQRLIGRSGARAIGSLHAARPAERRTKRANERA